MNFVEVTPDCTLTIPRMLQDNFDDRTHSRNSDYWNFKYVFIEFEILQICIRP